MSASDTTVLRPDSPEAQHYNRTRRWLEIGDLGLSFGFLAVLLAPGWTNTLRDWAVRMAGDHYVLQLFYYVLFLSILSKVLGFGLDFYGFRLEHRYNLSNQRLGSWLKDAAKGWVLGLVLGTVLCEIVYALIRTSPEHWWIFGWLIFLAVFLHKAPEGFTMASVMLASGRSRRAAFYAAVALAVATICGVLVIELAPAWMPYGLPVSAGVALYVGASDLVPEVNREPGIRMALVFFLGVAAFLALRIALPAL